MILARFLWGSVFIRGDLRKYAKKIIFKHFESALYSTSLSMPLTTYLKLLNIKRDEMKTEYNIIKCFHLSCVVYFHSRWYPG